MSPERDEEACEEEIGGQVDHRQGERAVINAIGNPKATPATEEDPKPKAKPKPSPAPPKPQRSESPAPVDKNGNKKICYVHGKGKCPYGETCKFFAGNGNSCPVSVARSNSVKHFGMSFGVWIVSRQ